MPTGISHRSLAIFLLFFAMSVNVLCFPATTAAQTADEQRAQRLNEQYLSVLKRNPRRGTALDKVYEFHVDRQSLPQFITELRASAEADSDDDVSWMLLGMLEARRGEKDAATSAFEHAEQARPEDPVASWYYADALVAVGKSAEATEALERALGRNPARPDQVQIFETLGRLHQRMRQPSAALDVWKRFEAAFPGDARVQEQVAEILVEEDQFEAALTKYAALAASSRDPAQAIQFCIKVADLKLRLGRTDEAREDLAAFSDRVKPGSWLYADVRRRLDETFLQTDDYAGLVAHYTEHLQLHADDLDAMSRVAKYLTVVGEADKARDWLQKAVDQAPSDLKSREALIAHLMRVKNFLAAIEQYEALAALGTVPTEQFENWGRLHLQRRDIPEQQRQAAAEKVWNQLLSSQTNDAVLVSRVAKLFRDAGMVDKATLRYQQAVELSPTGPQYHEYLGEYFHSLGRSDEAVAAWQQMAANELRSAENLVHLAETLQNFGYAQRALDAMKDACELERTFRSLVHFAAMLRTAGEFDDALVQLDLAAAIAEGPAEFEQISEERIRTLRENGTLKSTSNELSLRLQSSNGTAEEWHQLALYTEALGDLSAASRAAAKAVMLDADSAPAWKTAARIHERAGLFADAARASAMLVNIDGRYRTEHLKKVVDLAAKLGRIDDALQAGEQLIASAPDNPEHYHSVADLCFRLGRNDAGLDVLQRAVRVNPSDRLSLKLHAQALADQFQSEDAIELYWRAFDESESFEEMSATTRSLAELYIRVGRVDELFDRLRSHERKSPPPRDFKLCLAKAYESVGDAATARQVLDSLNDGVNSDRSLLAELTSLAEQTSDFKLAAEYQTQLNALAPSAKGLDRLANLLLRSGEIDSAEAVWMKYSDASRPPHEIVEQIDQLIGRKEIGIARRLAERMVQQNGNDWEALLRLAWIDWISDRHQQSLESCDRLLAISLSASAECYAAQVRRTGTAASSAESLTDSMPAPLKSIQMMRNVGIESGLLGGRVSSSLSVAWAAENFAQSRSIALLLKAAGSIESGSGDALLSDLIQRARAAAEDSHAVWDAFYCSEAFAMLRNGVRSEQSAVAKIFQRQNDPSAQAAFLILFGNRAPATAAATNSAEFRKQLLQAFNVVVEAHPEWILHLGGVSLIVDELERGKETTVVGELFQRLLRPEATRPELLAVYSDACRRSNVERMLETSVRLAAMPVDDKSESTASRFAFTAWTAVEREDWESVAEITRSFLLTKAASPTLAGTATTALGPATDLAVQANFRIYRSRIDPVLRQDSVLTFDQYWPKEDVEFLVNMWEIYRKRSGSELLNILTTVRETADDPTAVIAELAIAHVCFLDEQKSLALVHLVRAAELAPDNATLRLRLARYYEKNNHPADALALLDTIHSIDHGAITERELLALELSMNLGDAARAKLAAERLSELRLPIQTSAAVAVNVRKLGLNEIADSLTARAQRDPGNDVTKLVTLMRERRAEGNTSVAAEIAHQILQQTAGMTRGPKTGESLDALRRSAIQTLDSAGQIDDIVQQVQQQIQRTPASVRLHEVLLEYFVAIGNKDEEAKTRQKLEVLRPVTIDSLLKEAEDLERTRSFRAACDKYLQVLKVDPQRFAQNYYQYLKTFSLAGRLPMLADVLMEHDLRKLQNSYYVVNEVIQTMFSEGRRGNGNPMLTDKALQLFEAAWNAFPNNRTFLLSEIQEDRVWELPLMIDYATVGLVPQTLQQSVASPWKVIVGSLQTDEAGQHPTGRISGNLNRLCAALRKHDRVKEFSDVVESATQKFPNWHAGPLLLAVLRAQEGDAEQSRVLIQSVIASPAVSLIPADVALLVARELQNTDEDLQSAVVQLLEISLREDPTKCNRSYEYSPGRTLADLYRRLGRSVDAVRQVHRTLNQLDHVAGDSSKGGNVADHGHRQQAAAGEHLLQMGFPVEALKLFRSAHSDNNGLSQELRDRLAELERIATKAISPEAVIDYLRGDVTLTESDGGNADLILTTIPNSGINSVLISRLLAVNKNDATAVQKLSAAMMNAFESPSRGRYSLPVAAVVFADAMQDSELTQRSFLALREYVKTATTDEVPPHIHETSLWLAARVTLNHPEEAQLAEQLIRRSVAAAKTTADPAWLRAMSEERGSLVSAAGHTAPAVAAMTQLLENILTDDNPERHTNSSDSPQADAALLELRARLFKDRALPQAAPLSEIR